MLRERERVCSDIGTDVEDASPATHWNGGEEGGDVPRFILTEQIGLPLDIRIKRARGPDSFILDEECPLGVLWNEALHEPPPAGQGLQDAETSQGACR